MLLMDLKTQLKLLLKNNRNLSIGNCSPLTACASIRLFKFFIAWSGFMVQFCPLYPFPWWCARGTMFAGVLFQICMHSLAAYLYQQ